MLEISPSAKTISEWPRLQRIVNDSQIIHHTPNIVQHLTHFRHSLQHLHSRNASCSDREAPSRPRHSRLDQRDRARSSFPQTVCPTRRRRLTPSEAYHEEGARIYGWQHYEFEAEKDTSLGKVPKPTNRERPEPML